MDEDSEQNPVNSQPESVEEATDQTPSQQTEEIGAIEPNSGHTWKKSLFIIITIVALSGLGFAGYTIFIIGDKNDGQNSPNNSSEAVDSSSVQLSETYENSSLDLELKHPADWKITEGTRSMKLESPKFTFPTLDKGDVEGVFRIVIKKGASSEDGKVLGSGYAITPSEKLAYSEPARDQRPETWLTAFGLNKPDNFGYFVVQGAFELKHDDTLGPSFAKEIDSYLIAGGYSSEELTGDLETHSVSVDQYLQTDQYKTAIEIIKSLKLK